MKKLFNKMTKDPYFLKGTIGVFLCLFALFGALNTGVVAQFITWVISFLFGWFFYVFYLILFLVGIRLILAKKEFKLHWDVTIFGIILLFVGCLIVTTNSMTNSDAGYLTFQNFFEKFKASVKGFPLIAYDKISGGLIGYLLVAILNSGITYVGTQVVGSILICGGTVMALIKTIIRLIKNVKDYKNRQIKKAESDFEVAENAKPFTTAEIAAATRTTTVITADSQIPKENTQSVAIQNPNGGVGVGLTSINRVPNGLGKARYNPNSVYETSKETTDLKNSEPVVTKTPTVSVPVEQPAAAVVSETVVTPEETKVEETPKQEIPLAKKATFKGGAIDPKTLALAQEQNEVLRGEDVKGEGPTKVKVKKTGKYIYPPLDLLEDRASSADDPANHDVCEARKQVINQAFIDFGVGAHVVSYTIGPAVTRYDLEMDHDKSAKSVERYVDDIASRLRGISCRFVQVVPGKTTSGLEIANKKASLVNFKDCLAHLPKNPGSQYYVSFGKDISGDFVEADLKDFPHLLVCGTTGSGKSVFMHSLVMTLIMRNKISELRLMIIDPKRVEFSKYRDLPFLLCPPINEADDALLELNELATVMEERYDLMESVDVQDVKQYNKYAVDHDLEILPRIVVIIDEYADLVEGNKQIQQPIVRLAQKARACGIHLIIATQRPSANVITGVIKSNIPTRVALLCSSVTDSVVILSAGGAEKLLGNGDMLVQSSLVSKTGNVRVQGSYVDNAETKRVIDFIKSHNPCEYDERFMDLKDKARLNTDQATVVTYDKAASDEEKYKQIREDVMLKDYCSISFIQRTYSVGFPRAGKIFNRLINDGVLGTVDEGTKGRKVLLHSVVPEERSGSVEQSSFTPDKKG